MKVHKLVCYILWGLWALGLVLTAVSLLCFLHDHWMFWKIVLPYNSVVLMLSMIPIEPGLCVAAVISHKKQGLPIASELKHLAFTAGCWLVYVSMYFHWTGGVSL